MKSFTMNKASCVLPTSVSLRRGVCVKPAPVGLSVVPGVRSLSCQAGMGIGFTELNDDSKFAKKEPAFNREFGLSVRQMAALGLDDTGAKALSTPNPVRTFPLGHGGEFEALSTALSSWCFHTLLLFTAPSLCFNGVSCLLHPAYPPTVPSSPQKTGWSLL